MADKFEFYDVLGILVPGVLLTYVFLLCFPGALALVPPKMSDALNTIAFTSLAIFVGQLIQAVSSLLEPLIYKTWGGRPSERALGSGLGTRYFPHATATRIRTKLQTAAGDKGTNRDLFLFAMQRAEGANSPRVAKFNALFAYHRALLVFMLGVLTMLIVSSFVGALSNHPRSHVLVMMLVALALLALIWHRAKQRAYYYVREVLMTAERIIDTPSGPTTKPS